MWHSWKLFTAAPLNMDRQCSEMVQVADTGVEYNEIIIMSGKKGAMSVVWRYFGFYRSDVDQETVYCKCCRV